MRYYKMTADSNPFICWRTDGRTVEIAIVQEPDDWMDMTSDDEHMFGITPNDLYTGWLSDNLEEIDNPFGA